MNVTAKLNRWLFEPSAKLTQKDQRSQARLLSMLLFFVLISSITYIILITLFWQDLSLAYQTYVGFITAVILLGAYLLSRTRWYETAVFALAIGSSWNIIHILNTSPDNTIFITFFILPVIISNMVLSIKKTAVIALIEFVAILYIIATLHMVPEFWAEGTMIISFYLLFVGLILLSTRHRNKLEQTRREQVLQQEARLQTYFDNATDWLFALDTHGNISSMNQIACDELEYSANEIIGQSPIKFLSETYQPLVQNMMRTLFQGKDIPFAEVEALSKNGRSIWLEVRGRKLFKNNKISSTFHIARNITDRKISEVARNKLNHEIKLLYETGRQLGQKIDLNTVYNTIYESIVSVVTFQTFIVSSYHAENQELTVNFVRHLGEEWDVTKFQPLSLTDTKPGVQKEVVYTGEARLINNYFEEIKTKHNTHYWQPPENTETHELTRSAILVPLKIDDQVKGIIQIHSNEINAFTQENLYFLEALSSHIIAAITNANLLQQSQNELIERQKAEQDARKRQAIAETLQTSIAILNSTLSLEDVLSQILDQLHHALPYDSAAIQQKEGDFLRLKAARGFEDNAALIGLGFQLDANLPNAEAVRTKSPLALDNVAASYPEFAVIASGYQASDIYSWLGVPLIAEDEVIGMITIDRHEIRPFSLDEILLATTFANHAAMAIHNAALYQELEAHSESLEIAVAERTLELERTSDQVRAILNNSPDAILFLNSDQTIIQWNPAFIELFEYSPEEVQSSPFLQLVEESDHEPVKHALATAVSTQTTCRLNITLQTKNGQLVETNAALAPIQEDSTLLGIVCSLHDISNFKEVERLKDAFVSSVSHELRTPITNLRLHHDLLHINPQRQDVYMARLGREIDRLNIIIEDLLRISRLDQKRIKPVLAEVNLIALVEQYTNDRNSAADNKQLTLSVSTSPAICTVYGDSRLLEQVISILLTNAMNYTPAGGEIHFSPQSKQENEQLWSGLRIHDTGLGIPENEQSQIFSRFFRGEISLDSGEPGTGLGLAIAREIMHLHDGQIELESTNAEDGTSFIIWLPAYTPPEPQNRLLEQHS